MSSKPKRSDQETIRRRFLASGPSYEYSALALDAFAILNGWKLSKDFGMHRLAGFWNTRAFRREGDGLQRDTLSTILDHYLSFTKRGTPCAILCQPFGHSHYEREIFDIELHLGLECRQPPNPLASFYYPGHALFLLFVRPGESVRWLPEQQQ